MGSLLNLPTSGQLGMQSNYQAQAAPIVNPLAPGQVAGAAQGVNGMQGQNQALYQAMAGQGASVQQQGLAGQQNVLGQQQQLANALQQQAAGVGPNPAQNMLSQATGQNVSNQAALMAGQRGAGANVGLMAREAAQQGANTQQQAAGQAATMQSQQQIAAQQALMQQQQAMAGGYNSMTGTGLTQQGQQMNQLGNMNQAALTNQGQVLGSAGQYNQAQVGSTGNMNSTNASTQLGNAQTNQALAGGLMQGLGAVGAAALTPLKAYSGGLASVHGIYHGDKPIKMCSGGMSMKAGGTVPGKPTVKGAKDTPKNDIVPAKLSPGEIVIPRSITQGDNPGDAAKLFVEKLLASKGSAANKQDHDEFKEALKGAIKSRKGK